MKRRTADLTFSRNRYDTKRAATPATKGRCRTLPSPWGADNTQKILDVLDEYNVKATFFVVSAWAEQYPDTAKAIVEHGHELMNHSSKHDHYNSLTADQIVADVNKCNDMIEGLTGVRPTLIRCPFGEYDDHVISAIRSIGMEPIQWDVEQSHTNESPLAIRLCGLLEGYYGRSENGLPDRPPTGGQAYVRAPPPHSQGPRNTGLGAHPPARGGAAVHTDLVDGGGGILIW